MKLKHICLPLISISLLHITSCDSVGDDEADLTYEERDNLTTESLDEHIAGDIIFWTTKDNTAAELGLLTFTGGTETVIGQQVYTYTKTDEYLFTISRTTSDDIYTIFETALDNTLMDNGTNSQLGSRFRELLHREEAIYTPEELAEISAILAPAGTQSSVTEDGILISHLNSLYTHLVTSSRLSQIRGTMAGTYYVDVNSVEIDFRKPTTAEMDKYRFITSDDWMPYVTYTVRPIERTEKGTWVIELNNS